MSGLLKYLLAQAALKGGKLLNEEMNKPSEPSAPPERPEPLTEEQMADPIQLSMYEAKMKEYMEWEQAQQAQPQQPPQQPPQGTGLLTFE